MDYANLSQHQVIRTILDDNPARRSPKQIADFLGLSLSSVEKWGEDPDDGPGSHMSSKYIRAFSSYTEDNRLIEYYAYHLGCRLVDLEAGNETNGEILDEVFNLDILRGSLSKTLKNALKDGDLNKNEKKTLREIAAGMIKELRTFQEELAVNEL